MSTRATIVINDDTEDIFLYRHHDGFPEIIEPDIRKAIESMEYHVYAGELASRIIGISYVANQRPKYEVSTCIHGD